MKLFFLLVVVPLAIWAQDIAVEEPIFIGPPIKGRPYPGPGPIVPSPPRVLPKKPFLVVTNGIIRRNFPFNVAVRNVGSTSRSISLTLILAGTSENGTPYTKTKYAYIKKGSTSAWVTFDTAKIPKGSYAIKVQGEGYEEKRQLTYAYKNEAMLVQLEKAIYSPGQTVRFRVFVIDALTNAVSPSDKCVISIRDSNGNLIEALDGPKFEKGKYEHFLVLGEKANQGIWGFEVQCGAESVYESFEVAEYSLPMFEVTTNIPSRLSYGDGKILVQIKAVYTFGEPVEGTGKVEISTWGGKAFSRDIVLANGESSFELDAASDLGATPDGYSYYDYTITVTDSISNSKGKVEGSFNIVPFKYVISMYGDQFIKPGSTYSYSITVATEEGTSFLPAGTVVDVTIQPQNIVQQLTLNSAGSASSSVAVPSDATWVNFQATAPESQTGYLYAYVPSDQQGGSIALYPRYDKTGSAKLNEWFEVKVAVGDKVDWIVYYVSTKGVLIESQRVFFKSKSKSATIWIKTNIKLYPSFTVTAAYLKGADIIAGSVEVTLNNKLNNFVELGFKDVEVKPGTNYSFTVDSICDSTVSLSFIDQRVLLLKSGNEVLKQDVDNALYSFNWEYIPYEDRYLPPYEWIFRSGRLQILTNVPPPPPPEYSYDKSLPSQPDRQENNAIRKKDANDPKVRKDFSETFCWTDVLTNRVVSSSEECGSGDTCRAKTSCKVPDGITKYIAYSVSMNTKYGIGVTDVPSSITAKLPFFIDCTFPYSVQRNEILLLNIAFFNSINKDQDIVITIPKNANYQGVDLAENGWTETATGYVKTVKAKASTNFKIPFAIKFVNFGIFSVQITAKGPLAGDGIEKSIRVIPEGIPRTITKSVMTVGNEPASTDLVCTFPDGVYPDTKSTLVTVSGDILGKALNNLEKLIQQPAGCGEQNLLYLVPDLAILGYLTAVNKITPALEAKLKQYIAIGVQNQLNYRRFDGSFSAFGNSDPSGSTWITVYTAASFNWASLYVTVDPEVTKLAMDFVISNQHEDGSFAEPGRVIHTDMQGGADVWTAAFISLVITGFIPLYPQFKAARDKADNYLVTALEGSTDVHSISMAAQALIASGHPEANNIYQRLYEARVETDFELFWRTQANAPEVRYAAVSLNVETAANGLIAFVLLGKKAEALKTAKYLVGQANEYGGFGASLDTVMALKALSDFATSFISSGAFVDLSLTPNVGDEFSAYVDAATSLSIQQYELNPNANSLKVEPSTDSTGVAITSLICNFYQDPAAVVPVFNVRYEFYRQCKWTIGLRICTSYIPAGTSNMALITVNLLSGYQYQNWWGSQQDPNVNKIESLNSGSKVVFYLNAVGQEEVCVQVDAWKAQDVSEIKGGTIVVSDYYDPIREGSLKYDVPDLSGPCWVY